MHALEFAFKQEEIMQPKEKANALIGHITYQLETAWGRFLVAKYIYKLRSSKAINSLHWFLGITEDASMEASILALSRIVVPHRSSISIQYLLDYLEQNPLAFPHISSNTLREQVATDRKSLEAISAIINNIKDQRDTTVAHLDKRHVNNPAAVYSYPPLNYQEVEDVFSRLLNIINNYNELTKPSREIFLHPIDIGVSEDMDYLARLIKEDNAKP